MILEVDFKPGTKTEGVTPYEHARSIPMSHPSKDSLLKLNCNEATYAPSPRVLEAISHFIQKEPIQWYPDITNSDLKQALSQYVQLPFDHLSVFNGCDHALETICRTYLRHGDEVVLFAPTYDNFRVFAETCGAQVRPLFASSAFSKNVEGLPQVLSPRTRLIYIGSPNNPTGTEYTTAEISWILEKAAKSPRALVIVDEAYFEYCGNTSLSLLSQHPNLIIVRSFSKALALAGLRCGYAISQPQNILTLETIRNGKSVNSLAQIAAIATLSDLPYYQEKISQVQQAREWVVDQFTQMDLETVTTPANFILVRVGNPEAVEQALLSHNILVRNRSGMPQLQGFLRITVGLRQEMESLMECFRKLDPLLLRFSSKVGSTTEECSDKKQYKRP